MPITYGDSGTNRTIRGVTYGDAGTNRTVRAIYYGDGGTNRLVYAALNLLGLDPTHTVAVPGTATATYGLTNAGLETATGSASTTWLTIGAAADYDVRLTVNSGTLTSGTVGSWINLGTSRAWTLVNSTGSPSVLTVNATVEVGIAGSGTALASATVIFTARLI